ncbi:MAG: energy transducer TonB, partial [Bacteroidales bacterium]|nr:energy transducer TonB [Bacteroidales bacterium]
PAGASGCGTNSCLVNVTFKVDVKGNIKNINITKGLGISFDNEIMRALRLTSGKWKPGISKGKNAEMEYSIVIDFGKAKK